MVWNEEVAQRDYMPTEERHALQLKRLQATVQRVYERVPFYRKVLNERDIEPTAIRSLDDLSRLSFTTRHDLLDNYPLGLLAVPRGLCCKKDDDVVSSASIQEHQRSFS